MFGIGLPELLIILVVALIVVGPSKLPDLAKSLGKGLSEFRKATDEIKSELTQSESFQDFSSIRKDFKETVDSMKPQGLLDAATGGLEPKEPKLNMEGRAKLERDMAAQAIDPEPAPMEDVVDQIKPAAQTQAAQGQAQEAKASAPAAPKTDA